MADYPNLPCKATATIEVASGGSLDSGYVLGRKYIDTETGFLYVLWQIDPALTNNAFAAGETSVLKANKVVTNDVSDGLDATTPIFTGLATAAHAESTWGGTTRYAFFLVDGDGTVTLTDGSVTAGMPLTTHTTTDGGCLGYDETATNLAAGITIQSHVGIAYATDVSTTTTARIKSLLF